MRTLALNGYLIKTEDASLDLHDMIEQMREHIHDDIWEPAKMLYDAYQEDPTINVYDRAHNIAHMWDERTFYPELQYKIENSKAQVFYTTNDDGIEFTHEVPKTDPAEVVEYAEKYDDDELLDLDSLYKKGPAPKPPRDYNMLSASDFGKRTITHGKMSPCIFGIT